MGRSDERDGELVLFRGDGRIVYRVLRARVPQERDWWSHYEQRARPRGIEILRAVDQMALSTFATSDAARAMTEHHSYELGRFIARVEVRAELGMWFAETGAAGHVAVWARAADFQRACVAVEPV
jgi:hypothetical protein